MRKIHALALAAVYTLMPAATAQLFGTGPSRSPTQTSVAQTSPEETASARRERLAALAATSPFSTEQHRAIVRWFTRYVKPEYLQYLRARDRGDVRAQHQAMMRLGEAMTDDQAFNATTGTSRTANLFGYEVFQVAGIFAVSEFSSDFIGYSRLKSRNGIHRNTHSLTIGQARSELISRMRVLDRALRSWIERYSGRQIG